VVPGGGTFVQDMKTTVRGSVGGSDAGARRGMPTVGYRSRESARSEGEAVQAMIHSCKGVTAPQDQSKDG
jgi:hypothetical protein